jgi:hypothetical protein
MAATWPEEQMFNILLMREILMAVTKNTAVFSDVTS